jgi:hypothetical protein
MTRKAAILASLPLIATIFACGGKLDELIPPIISSQPSNQTVKVGSAFGFAVLATGANLSYQWSKLNTTTSTWEPITGATNPTYSKTTSVLGDAGSFRVVVTNPGGSVTSSTATLTVNP